MSNESIEQGYTVQQAAEALGVSEMTIRRHIKQGKLKAWTVEGKYGNEYRIELSTKPLTKSSGEVAALVNRIEQLSQEVGYWRGRYEEAIDQVKLLKSGQRPWWQRLFNRNRP